jgi:hypothetical protein
MALWKAETTGAGTSNSFTPTSKSVRGTSVTAILWYTYNLVHRSFGRTGLTRRLSKIRGGVREQSESSKPIFGQIDPDSRPFLERSLRSPG